MVRRVRVSCFQCVTGHDLIEHRVLIYHQINSKTLFLKGANLIIKSEKCLR